MREEDTIHAEIVFVEPLKITMEEREINKLRRLANTHHTTPAMMVRHLIDKFLKREESSR